ncbi:hypothetical protein KSP40_PGU020168 [Platanthera guangdongensis]|uniref:Uncharacterized protein n=1 Tax=Platanthera guangdongensis TaxID=2320717 RepID=A0ABR2MP37_9ASPA
MHPDIVSPPTKNSSHPLQPTSTLSHTLQPRTLSHLLQLVVALLHLLHRATISPYKHPPTYYRRCAPAFIAALWRRPRPSDTLRIKIKMSGALDFLLHAKFH